MIVAYWKTVDLVLFYMYSEVQHDGLSTASARWVECVGCGESMRETRERCLKIGENLEEK